MAKLLHTTKNRDESHRKLEELRTVHPRAECREDANALEYTVWDGPAEPYTRDAESGLGNNAQPGASIDLNALADLVAARLRGDRT